MKKKEETLIFDDKTFKKYVNKEQIRKKVTELAELISKDYSDKKPVFLIVLKGGVFFAADLLREINIDCEIEVVSAKSYGLSTNSSGKVRVSITNLKITGKDVIIIEDIIDTGYTLKSLFDKLKTLEPASLEAVAFLSKPEKRMIEVDIKYIGYEIPPIFVIGYGLDYAEHGRNLPEVYAMME